MSASLTLTRLTTEDASKFELGAFSCGDAAYNTWLANCITQVRSGTAAVFVLAEETPHGQSARHPVPVSGYFALALTVVSRDDLSNKLAKGQDLVPAYLLARLALSADLRGGTAGRNLLANALARMVVASETIPSRLLVIDAERPKVARLYASWGFTATLGLDDDVDLTTGLYRTNLRLVAKTSSIRAALPQAMLV